MRIRRADLASTRRKAPRRALTATALAAIFAGGSLLSAGTAAASPVAADGCSGTVVGPMGETVVVQGPKFYDLVKQGADEARNLFNFITVNGDTVAKQTAAKGAIAVGSVPQGQSGTVGGEAVATAVTTAIKDVDGLGWLPGTRDATLKHIKDKLAKSCGLNTYASNYVAPTSNTPSSTPGGTAGQPGGPGHLAPGMPGSSTPSPTGIAPPRNYGNIPVAVPGVAVPPGARYPQAGPLPGAQSPEFGVLGGDQPQGTADVRNAGKADSLAADGTSGTVQLPMLLAVIALAGVTAALVRTWVLRRVSP